MNINATSIIPIFHCYNYVIPTRSLIYYIRNYNISIMVMLISTYD